MEKSYLTTIPLVFLLIIIFTNVAYAKNQKINITNTIYLTDKQDNPKTGERIYKIDHISSLIMTNALVNKTINYEVTPNSKIIVTNSKITSSYTMNVSDPTNPIGYRLVPVNEQEKITFGDKLANSRPDLVFEYNIKGADKLSYYVTMLANPHPPKILQNIINPVRIFFETGPSTAIMITDSSQDTNQILKWSRFKSKLRLMGDYHILNMFRWESCDSFGKTMEWVLDCNKEKGLKSRYEGLWSFYTKKITTYIYTSKMA